VSVFGQGERTFVSVLGMWGTSAPYKDPYDFRAGVGIAIARALADALVLGKYMNYGVIYNVDENASFRIVKVPEIALLVACARLGRAAGRTGISKRVLERIGKFIARLIDDTERDV